MKHFFSSFLLLFFLVQINAQDIEQTKKSEQEPKVVINHKMIEKFNKADFPKNAMSFNNMLSNYCINDVKLIVSAYHTEDFTITTEEALKGKLAELKKKIQDEDIKQPPNYNLLTQTK